MRKYFLVFVLLLSAAAYAHADDECCEHSVPKWYLRALGGWNAINSQTHDGVTKDYKDGYYAGGALGFHFTPFLSVEGEIAYRENVFNELKFENSSDIPLRGRLNSWTYMGNAVFELPLLSFLKPYAGVGAGYIQQDGFIQESSLARLRGFDNFSISDSGFAWQGLAGISCEIFRKTELKVEYHYLDGDHFDPNHAVGLTLQRSF